jgi:hypothetical protein
MSEYGGDGFETSTQRFARLIQVGWVPKEVAERLRASNEALVEAAAAFDACLSDLCDGPERDKLRAAIAAAKGEK